MSFWAATCWHGEWADEGSDVFGDRECAKCGTKVRVVLTEAGFKTDANMLATQGGMRRVFDDID